MTVTEYEIKITETEAGWHYVLRFEGEIAGTGLVETWEDALLVARACIDQNEHVRNLEPSEAS